MMDLSFLSKLEIVVPEKTTKPRTSSAIPLLGEIRIRKNGKVEFSDEFRTRVNGNWIDMFQAHNWLQYDKKNPNLIFLNITQESDRAKADIKSECVSQFIKGGFWDELATVLEFDVETPYVDLTLSTTELKVPVALLPKVVTRGEDKGNITYAQRNDAVLIPVMLHEDFVFTTNDTEPEVLEEEEIEVLEEDEDVKFE